MPPVTRIMPAVFAIPAASTRPARSWSTATHYANDVAAVPSLHAAFSLMVAITLWPRKHKWLRPARRAVPAGDGASRCVYGAEHYVSDILLGWVYTIVRRCSARAASSAGGAERRERTARASDAAPGRQEPEPHPEPAYARAEQ